MGEGNRRVELHDSSVQSIRAEGADIVIAMDLYVHESNGRPGVDPGIGWYQDAEVRVDAAVIDERTFEGELLIADGDVFVNGERFRNGYPLPFEPSGVVRLEMPGVEGSLVVTGRSLRTVLLGPASEAEQFPGTKTEAKT